MVGVLTSSMVDREFEPRLGQTKDYKIVICCLSAKHAALRRKHNDSWLGVRIMCMCRVKQHVYPCVVTSS